MKIRSVEIYGGDQPTDATWRQTALDIAEPVLIRQMSLWIGADRDHRGDLLAALFIRHANGQLEGPLDSLPWDHYKEESIRPQDKNFTPYHFEAEPGSKIELWGRGASFSGSWNFLPTCKIWFTNE
jgi:hypothetical protein